MISPNQYLIKSYFPNLFTYNEESVSLNIIYLFTERYS